MPIESVEWNGAAWDFHSRMMEKGVNCDHTHPHNDHSPLRSSPTVNNSGGNSHVVGVVRPGGGRSRVGGVPRPNLIAFLASLCALVAIAVSILLAIQLHGKKNTLWEEWMNACLSIISLHNFSHSFLPILTRFSRNFWNDVGVCNFIELDGISMLLYKAQNWHWMGTWEWDQYSRRFTRNCVMKQFPLRRKSIPIPFTWWGLYQHYYYYYGVVWMVCTYEIFGDSLIPFTINL